ncbi:gas vesicle protein [Streptomyces sp. NPDC057302]|uniref:gas vesicle protein n=1 Tax=Streptomyces sp. NPDC057302 TaxID=3346094 RepID=UPI0036255689
MSDSFANRIGSTSSTPAPYGPQGGSANLADILERVLDKGVVIAGDIKINLLDIELLTIKLRLLVASVDKAKEMGIDWWEHDPSLSSRARPVEGTTATQETRAVESQQSAEIERLRAEVAELREAASAGSAQAIDSAGASKSARESEAK